MKTFFLLEGDLPVLLRGKRKGSTALSVELTRRASIKDMLESFGIPHTEVGSITLGSKALDYNDLAVAGSEYIVRPVSVPFDVTKPSLLRPQPLSNVSFLADVNVGRLARYLRAAGLDTLYDHRWRDEYIAELLLREQRILLTRDLRLLMRKHIRFGRYIRATDPEEQLGEVISLFGLGDKTEPLSRCLDCNSPLSPVAKEDVLHRLEPLTRKYYSTFSICPRCDKVFWPGSHVEKMQRLFHS